MKLSEIVATTLENAVGLVLDEPSVGKQLMRAVRVYAGHATISALPPEEGAVHSPVPPQDDIAANDFDLNLSEWSVIKPLFELYCEEQNALRLEASRGLGIDVYGRTVSEIAQEIKMVEDDMARRAFFQPVFSL